MRYETCFKAKNNIDIVQSIVCHIERSEPLGRWPEGEKQTSRKCLLRSPCARSFALLRIHIVEESIIGQLLYYLLIIYQILTEGVRRIDVGVLRAPSARIYGLTFLIEFR